MIGLFEYIQSSAGEKENTVQTISKWNYPQECNDRFDYLDIFTENASDEWRGDTQNHEETNPPDQGKSSR